MNEAELTRHMRNSSPAGESRIDSLDRPILFILNLHGLSRPNQTRTEMPSDKHQALKVTTSSNSNMWR